LVIDAAALSTENTKFFVHLAPTKFAGLIGMRNLAVFGTNVAKSKLAFD